MHVQSTQNQRKIKKRKEKAWHGMVWHGGLLTAGLTCWPFFLCSLSPSLCCLVEGGGCCWEEKARSRRGKRQTSKLELGLFLKVWVNQHRMGDGLLLCCGDSGGVVSSRLLGHHVLSAFRRVEGTKGKGGKATTTVRVMKKKKWRWWRWWWWFGE